MSVSLFKSSQRGFTIIEVLTVVIVVGILASIVVASYNGAQNRAHDAAVRSDLDVASGLLENFRVSATNTAHAFPQNTTELAQVGIKATKSSYKTTLSSNFIYCVDSTTRQTYDLVAESKSGTIFTINQDGFQSTTTLDESKFSDPNNICSSLSSGYVSAGMSSPNTWQVWVST